MQVGGDAQAGGKLGAGQVVRVAARGADLLGGLLAACPEGHGAPGRGEAVRESRAPASGAEDGGMGGFGVHA